MDARGACDTRIQGHIVVECIYDPKYCGINVKTIPTFELMVRTFSRIVLGH